MTAAISAETRQHDRTARRVRRGHLRLAVNSSRLQAVFFLEESLRLVSLPGEREGRVYYFRSVSLPALASHASRYTWQSTVEVALQTLARQAIHGLDPGAGSANAVFFDSGPQALEALLGKLLRGSAATEWFWAQIVQDGTHETRSAMILSLIEQIREQPASWSVVAEIVLRTLETADPAILLTALPIPTVHAWLVELDRQSSPRRIFTHSHFSHSAIRVLSQAARHCGWDDPRIVWLTSLVILRGARDDWETANAVVRARVALRQLATENQGSQLVEPELTLPEFSESNSPANEVRGECALVQNETLSSEGSNPRATKVREDGLPTKSAGLYFLLNALRRLGIEAALQSDGRLADADFLARLFQRMAKHAGVSPEDPILAWALLPAAPDQNNDVLLETEFSGMGNGRNLWPANLAFPDRLPIHLENLLRGWSVAVRRWCWREAGVTVQEVVSRDGFVRLTRADLDVTLPMDSVDIRIRRVGLDIDPGWIPWFGRVVRFHYRNMDSREQRC
jgi:hypothetical protein